MAANPRIKNSSVSEDSGTDYLEPFIESTISAATRFRRVLLVVIITSVLGFGAFWNSWQGSWINSRIQRANEAKPYLDYKDKLAKIPDELKTLQRKIPLTQSGTLERKYLEEDKNNLENEEKQAQVGMSNTKPETLQWLANRNINNKEELKVVLDQLEKDRSELTKIRVPFFNTAFDINDLGLLGGFTFVVVLMWFRFSLWREYYNLVLAFDAAKEEHKEFCYNAIGMRQVLTVPPTLYGKQPPIKPMGKVVRVLYFLPCVVQLAVLINDCCTFPIGWMISKFDTIFSISASLCFLVLSIMLTVWCFQLSSDIDEKWKEFAETIRIKLASKVAAPKLRG